MNKAQDMMMFVILNNSHQEKQMMMKLPNVEIGNSYLEKQIEKNKVMETRIEKKKKKMIEKQTLKNAIHLNNLGQCKSCSFGDLLWDGEMKVATFT